MTEVDRIPATRETADVISLNAALDADPSDQRVRGMLADALDEAGEYELAEGMRAVAALGRVPKKSESVNDTWEHTDTKVIFEWWMLTELESFLDSYPKEACLTADWWSNLVGGWNYSDLSMDFPTRRDAEYAAARAWCRLPAERKLALLSTASEG